MFNNYKYSQTTGSTSPNKTMEYDFFKDLASDSYLNSLKNFAQNKSSPNLGYNPPGFYNQQNIPQYNYPQIPNSPNSINNYNVSNNIYKQNSMPIIRSTSPTIPSSPPFLSNPLLSQHYGISSPSLSVYSPSYVPSNLLKNTGKPSSFKKEEDSDEITIQVWDYNLEEEMKRIKKLSEKYCVVGYDSEFPGVIYEPKGFDYKSSPLSYEYLKANVDNLDVIQIGFTLCDFEGNHPVYYSSQSEFNNCKILSWQFNFKFDLNKKPHNLKSISLLKEAGIDFDQLSLFGIDHSRFGRFLFESQLISNENIKWITFHSMFDYGYLIKLLISQPLPKSESQFFSLFHSLFPVSFDIKYFFHHFTSIKIGGLEGLSKSFKLKRKGVAHQSGSDSHLTNQLFFSILQTYRNQWKDESFQQNLNGSIFGLNFNSNPINVY